MRKRPRREQLDADVIGDEVFTGDGEAIAVVDIDRGRTGQNAVVAVGDDGTQTDTNCNVALRLGKGGRGERGQRGGKGQSGDRFHGLSNRCLVGGTMRRTAEADLDAGQHLHF